MMKMLSFLFCLYLFLLSSCSQNTKGMAMTVIQYQVPFTSENILDIDKILIQADKIVRDYLPRANYEAMVFRSNCSDVLKIKGKLVVMYTQVTQQLLSYKPEVLFATINVDINNNTIDLNIWDRTDSYLVVNSLPPVSNEAFSNVLQSATRYLSYLGIENCEVDINQFKESWDVSCYPVSEDNDKCAFSIDPETFEVLEEYVPPK